MVESGSEFRNKKEKKTSMETWVEEKEDMGSVM